MTHKKCFKCNNSKPLPEFYKHPQMADGHVNKCKECNKKDVISNRRKNSEYYKAYDRKRGNRQPPGYLKEYRKRFPKKYKAHSLVSNAVRDGRLEKPNVCEACNQITRVEAHHDDYDKPLEVRWLCSGCHKIWHAENGEGKNAQ